MKSLFLVFILLVLTFSVNAQTWALKHTLPGTNYLNIEFPTLTTGYAVGSNVVSKSIDTGNNWTDQTLTLPGNCDIITDLHFFNKDTGVIVGSFSGTNGSPSSAFVMRTTNGGTTWTTQLNLNSNYPPIYSVSFHGKDTGYAGGGEATRGDIYKTVDGGITWNLVYTSGFNPKFMCALWAVTNNKVIAVGNDESNTWWHELWRSDPTGSSFTEDYYLPAGTSMDQFDIQFPDPQHGYIEANTGPIGGQANYYLQVKTSDGGATWALQNTLPAGFGMTGGFFKNGMYYTSKDTGFIAANAFYATTDGGLTWAPQVVPAGTSYIKDEFFISSRLGFACGDGQILKFSKPGGITPPPPVNVLTAALSPSTAEICAGKSVQLTTTTQTPAGPVTYSWSPAAGLSCTSCASPVATPTATTTYSVSISDGTTTLVKTVTITVDPVPVISIAGNNPLTVEYATATALTASGATAYSWSPGTYLNTTSGATVTTTPYANITYTVTGTDGKGCSAAAQINIDVHQSGFGIPNAFSPNNDGLNDYFHVINSNPAILIHTMVFNRWGQEVYNGFNDKRGWDGTLNGKPAALGVYMYAITAMLPDGTTTLYKGNLTLVR